MVSRRTAVIGLGGLLVGGGGLLSTGAFTTIETQRSVSLETAGDANAFLGLEILDPEFVDETDGTIEFDLAANATTTYEDLIDVRNNGTQVVTSLRFEFLVSGAEQDDEAAENALLIVSGDAAIDAVDDANLLRESDAANAEDDRLDPGEAVPIGIGVDLTGDAIDRIDGDPEITLRIIADTGGVGDDPDEGQPTGEPAFEHVGSPSRDPPDTPPQSVRFEIENVGNAAVSLNGFTIEFPDGGPGRSDPPENFEGFGIATPSGGERFGGQGDVSDDAVHGEYDIAPGETAEYTIEAFDRDLSDSGVDLDVTVISTAGERFGIPTREV